VPRAQRIFFLTMARADCPHCQGSGWKVVERTTEGAQALASAETARPGAAAGEPKMVWAVPCDCTTGDRPERALARARVPERYRHHDFENFDTDPYESKIPEETRTWHGSLARAKLQVKGFAENYPSDAERGLLLMGPCGVGKTHLAVAALNELVRRGHSGLFYDYRELLKEIQNSYNPESGTTEMGVLDPVLKVEVLMLDDLGASKSSDWALETVGHVLNKRYNDNRVTILTTNFLDPDFKKDTDLQPSSSATANRLPSGETLRSPEKETLADRIGKRIRSRLYEMCRGIEIWAPDYRKDIRKFSRAGA
jgi:DNA replication protein DnaC